MTPGQRLIALTAGVLAAFLIVTVITQLREGGIDRQVDTIVSSSLPSVRCASNVRQQLRRIESDLDELQARPGQAREAGRRLAQHQSDLDASLKLCPPLAHAGHRYLQTARRGLAELGSSSKQIVSALPAGEAGAAAAVLGRAHQQVDEVDAALERYVDYHTAQAQEIGFSIARLRMQNMLFIFLLDLVCLALAAGVIALAVRQFRRRSEVLIGELDAARNRVRTSEQETADIKQQAATIEREVGELEVFCERVAHDVLGPVSTMALVIHALKERQPGEPQVQSLLATGESSVAGAKRIVDGLIAFARAGATPSAGACADLEEIVQDLVSEVSLDVQQAEAELILEPLPRVMVACTPGALTSVLSNLLRNAIKYVHAGARIPWDPLESTCRHASLSIL